MRAWLLVLVCWAAAAAVPYPEVYPPDASLVVFPDKTMQGPGVAWERGQAQDLVLGSVLRCSCDGYATAVVAPEQDELSGARPIRVNLRPLTWSVGALDWVRFHPVPAALAFVLIPVVGVSGWRRWRLRGASDADAPLVGRKLARWRLVSKLGQGGMATVYKAVPDLTLSEAEAVAIKVMNPGYGQSDPDAAARFQREARLAVSLEHPNIVRTLKHGDHGGLLYLVMELVPGTPLSHRLVPTGLPLEEALDLVRPVLAALDHAHGRGVVHRDVKPDNVMLTRDGRVLLMDFGVARAADLTAITPTGLAMGTPSYMPPEQLTGGVVDPRADQYALGIMLYQLVTGRLPFTGGDPSQVALLHVTHSPEPPRTWRPELPPSVERVILKMICKDPEGRFPNLTAVAEALERAGREPDAFAEWERPAASAAPRAAAAPPASGEGSSPEGSDPGEDTVGVPRMG